MNSDNRTNYGSETNRLQFMNGNITNTYNQSINQGSTNILLNQLNTFNRPMIGAFKTPQNTYMNFNQCKYLFISLI